MEFTDKTKEDLITGFTENMIDALMDTFFVFNPNTGKAIRWNSKFREISGYTDEEIVDLKAPDFYYSPEDLEKAAAATKDILSKGQGKVEMSFICKDGRKIPTEYLASAIKDEKNNIKYIISIGRDITERKLTENELKFRSGITEQVNASVISTGLDFKINWVNQAFITLYGYSSDEAIGQTPDFLNVDPLSEEIQNDIYKKVSSGEVWKGEALNRKKDDTVFLCRLDIFPIKDENGDIFAYAGHQYDITERRQAEDALKKKVKELEEFYNMSVGREVKMMELKKEIIRLNEKLSQYEK